MELNIKRTEKRNKTIIPADGRPFTVPLTYWGGNGIYSKENSELFDKLVPSQGTPETEAGKLVWGMGRLIHEYHNNGNGNIVDVNTMVCGSCDGTGFEGDVFDMDEDDEQTDCYRCDGECEIFDSNSIDDFFNTIINEVENIFQKYGIHEGSETMSELRIFLTETGNECSHSLEEVQLYNKIGDYCMALAIELDK